MSDDMWTRSVQQMKDAILEDNNMNSFFRKFDPAEDEGYAWTMDPEYRRYTATLDSKTDRIHSGSSFAMCVRCAVEKIRADDKEIFAPAPAPSWHASSHPPAPPVGADPDNRVSTPIGSYSVLGSSAKTGLGNQRLQVLVLIQFIQLTQPCR